MNRLLLLPTFLSISLALFSQDVSYFDNPVNRGVFADPSIVKVVDTYYVTATSSEWAPHLPVFTSVDLINLEQVGHIFNEKPEWTSHSFWAPELYYLSNKMYCYYTARRKSDNVSYIGVASSEGTSLDFKDHGPIIEYGTEAIDPFVYEDNGDLYITWKAYGLDNRPIELLGSRLSSDGLRLEGEIFSLLKDEGIGLEGQYHFKQGNYYYIIYSAKSCCGPGSDYDVRVARSTSFRGPYEKYSENPILYGDGKDYISCGHGTVVETDLCLRPQTTRYYYSTKVNNVNDSFKGLTMYGDDKNMVAIGVKNNKVEVKSVREGKKSILYSNSIEKGDPYFKIEVERGRLLRFFYSIDGENWISVNDSVFDATHLVRWDRVARPGLIHIGDYNAPAVYGYFELNNI